MKKIKMRKRTVALMMGLFLFLVPRLSQAIGIEGAIGVWFQNPSGGIGYKGDSLNLENDLKYSQTTRLFGRAKIQTSRLLPNIYIQLTPMSFEGTGQKNVNFTFGNQTFNANVPFSSSLKLDQYDLGLYYGLPFIKTAAKGRFNVDIGLNVRIFDFLAEVSQSGIKKSQSFLLPLPMIYLGAQFEIIKSLSLEGEGRALAYNSNHFYDLVARIKYNFWGPVFASAGYRYQDISIDSNEVKANITFSGPLLEAGMQF